MLRKFRVKNFLSFRDWQTLDLTVAGNAPEMPGRFVQSVPGSKDRFPTFVAIFGANASGKTNILRALTFVNNFVRYSQSFQPNLPIGSIPFSGEKNGDSATEFEVELDSYSEDLGYRVRFDYKLAISQDQKTVLKEELNYYPKNRARRLFLRRDQAFKFGDDFKIRRNDPSIKKIRQNGSVISTLAQFNHSLSEAIVASLGSIQTNVHGILGNQDISSEGMSKYYKENPHILNKFVEFSKKFDIGIENVEIAFDSGSPEPRFYHRGVHGPIMRTFESHGTNKIFSLFPILNYMLEFGSIAFVDELDNAIHSLLLPEIIGKFLDIETNPRHAQLITVCHNPSIMDYLEKEEVFFAEKGADGVSTIYGLKEVQGVRRESNIYANYISGAFGGVPRIA